MEEHPTRIIVWQNGVVMAFGVDGQQMPDWQGRYEDLKDKIDSLPGSIKVERGNWQAGTLA